ncbi:MAG: HU family DNA-binding protein [Mycoplasmatales bacterium]
MKKKDLIAAIAEATGLTKKDSEKAVEAFLETVKDEVKKGNKVSLLGFGNFEPKTNSARKGINPATKQPIDIKASNSVKFKVGKGFKDSLN